MKLAVSNTSPYARKCKIVAIELGLTDRIECVATPMGPGPQRDQYARDINPLRKIPALTLDDGSIIIDSFLIAEYLDELGGHKLMPASGPKRWQARSEHMVAQGMIESMQISRFELNAKPETLRRQSRFDDHWDRVRQGMRYFEERPEIFSRPLDLTQIALVCALGYADLRFADYPWRDAYPKLAAFNEVMLQRPSIRDTVPKAG